MAMIGKLWQPTMRDSEDKHTSQNIKIFHINVIMFKLFVVHNRTVSLQLSGK